MKSRALAILRRSAESVALGGVFAVAVAGGVVLHANTKTARRLIASLANDTLAGTFQGRLAVGEIDNLSLGTPGHLHIKAFDLTDPDGRPAIHAEGVDVELDVRALARSIVAGRAPELRIHHAKIDKLEVVLDADTNGDFGITRAFRARPSAKPKPPAKPPSPNDEDVRLSMPDVKVQHTHVHGNVVPPGLDADADDLRANLSIATNRLNLELDGTQATVRSPRAPGQIGDVHARAKGHLAMPLSGTRRDIVMKWELDGDAAGIPLTADVGLEQDRLTAHLDVPTVAPEIVKHALPVVPITKPLALHAEASGEMGKALVLQAKGQAGDAAFTADGELGLGDKQLPFRVDADLTRIDAATFTGPTSDISGHVHAEGTLAGGLKGTFRVATKEGTAQGQPVPAIAAEGRFDTKQVDASFHASEPGVEVDGELTLHVPEQTLGFDVRARSKDLRSLARAPRVLSGAGTAHATGTVDLARASIDAHVTADGTGVGKAPASAGNVHAEATVSGPLASPVVDVTASAKQIALTAASSDPKEPKKEPLVYPSATARARILVSAVPRILDAKVHVDGAEDGAAIDASATEIVLGGKNGVDVRGARVTGLGAPIEADTHIQDGALVLRAQGKDLDLERIASMTGIKQLKLLPKGSRGSLDVDLRATASRADGHFDLSIAGAKDGTAAEVHAKLDGRHVSAHGRVVAGSMGWIEMQRAEVNLPGPPSVENVKRATGAVNLYGQIDLSQGAALFGGESIEQISGTALVSARVERGDARTLPTVYATATTRDLDVTFNNEGKSTHIAGIDAAVHVGYDGASDEAEVSALTWDAKGIVASADTKARVPLFAWLTGSETPDLAAIRALGIDGVVDVPRREVGDLPGELARKDLLGGLAAHAVLSGTIGRPSVTLVASADDLRERKRAAGGEQYSPIDGVLEARWNGHDVVATLRVDEDPTSPAVEAPDPHAPVRPSDKERKSGHVRGLVLGHFPMSDLLDGRSPRWDASGELDVADLELAPLPLPQRVQGALTGRFKLRDLMTNPSLDGRAHVDNLGIAGARVLRGEVKAEAKNGSLDATAVIRQADGGTGRVKVSTTSLVWHGVDVEWDASKATRLEYKVDRFQLAILRPIVRRAIPEIEGRVDGTGSATVDANTHVFEGGMALSQGRLYVNAIGEEVSDIKATLRFDRDGHFRVQDATAKIGAGEVKTSVTGQFKGLHFESAQAVITMPSKDGVPLSSEGATFAQATGEVRLQAVMSPDTKALLVTVAVPRSKITLPDRSTQNLQSLDADEAIAIGIRKPDGSLATPAPRPGSSSSTKADAAAAAAEAASSGAAPAQPLAMKFTVALGDDVQLEGRGLKLQLKGKTLVDIAQEVAVTGQITLNQGGTIDVQGRKFVVDRGTVTFVAGEDPADPVVIAAAYWDAPDSTRIWVEFNGPLKTGKLTLRSEPPFSKNEILSILLFGRADPNAAPQGERPSDGQQATALGTGIASAGLNKALGELDDDFELEQDKTSANRLRTKVGYKLRRNLKVQLGYASGFSQREPDTTYLFLEWLFIPQWSLIGTRGDRGTSILDVQFQHRY